MFGFDRTRSAQHVDEPWLSELLTREPVPGSAEAELRTISAVRLRATAVAASHPRSTPSFLVPRAARAAALAACAAVALVGASFTPPGRAATGALGELVGIGDPPTIDHAGTIDEGGPGVPVSPGSEELLGGPQGREVVVGTGTTSGGARFEVTAYRTSAPDPGSSDAQISVAPGLALAVDFPGVGGERRAPGSLTVAPLDQWGVPVDPGQGLSPSSAAEQPGLAAADAVLVAGDAPAEATRVEVRYTDPETGETEGAPAQLFPIDGPLLEQIGVETRPFGYWVAFLPETRGGSGDVAGLTAKVEVRAYDADGQEVSVPRSRSRESRRPPSATAPGRQGTARLAPPAPPPHAHCGRGHGRPCPAPAPMPPQPAPTP